MFYVRNKDFLLILPTAIRVYYILIIIFFPAVLPRTESLNRESLNTILDLN